MSIPIALTPLSFVVANAIIKAGRRRQSPALITPSALMAVGYGQGIATRKGMAGLASVARRRGRTSSVTRLNADPSRPAYNSTIFAASVAASTPRTWKRSLQRRTHAEGIAGCVNRRIDAEYRQPRLFTEPAPKAVQEALL